jgi:hypothetical protein
VAAPACNSEDLTQRNTVASRRANNFDTHFHRKHLRLHATACISEDLTQRTAVANRRANNFDTINGLSLPVIVEDLSEDAWMPVEEILVEHGIVVSERLRESREAGRGDFLQRRLVPWTKELKDTNPLKVHKNENFFGFDFECCTISMLVMQK